MSIIKQQVLLERILENGRKPGSEQKSIRQLILDAGYSESAADNPQEILSTISWQELISLIPKNDILNKLIKNALQERSIHGSNNAIDTLLKVMGGYAPTKLQVSTDEELSDEELEKQIEEKKRQIEEQKARNSSKTDENDSKQLENTSKQDENITKTNQPKGQAV